MAAEARGGAGGVGPGGGEHEREGDGRGDAARYAEIMAVLDPRHRAAIVSAGIVCTARQRLSSAISNGDVAEVDAVLREHPGTANVDIDEGGVRPLHQAAAQGNLESVNLLLVRHLARALVCSQDSAERRMPAAPPRLRASR